MTIRLVFHFNLVGSSEGSPTPSVSFGYPNVFWIDAEAPSIQPEEQDNGNERIKPLKISGRVTDVTLALIPNASVTLKPASGDEPTQSTRTNSDGTFTFSIPPLQRWDLSIEAAGFKQTTRSIDAPAGTDIEIGDIVLDVGLVSIADVVEAEVPPFSTTLCELVAEPARYKGLLVQVRAEVVSKYQWTGFIDPQCAAKIPVGTFHVLDDLKPEEGEYAFTTADNDHTHPESLTWRQIKPQRPGHLIPDDNYRAFQKFAAAKYRWPDKGVCQDCPLYRITVTATARFDYFPTQTVAVRSNPATKAVGYSAGDSNVPLLRLVLQSVSDVTTSSIDPSVYTATGLRQISPEEASNLLTAFLKLPGSDLLKSGNMGYTEFYFLMAILGVSRGPVGGLNARYYAVDRKTGDVWNSVICRQITSRALKNIQLAIRKRIGLTDEEYHKLQRPGPMCEPGMPRVTKSK